VGRGEDDIFGVGDRDGAAAAGTRQGRSGTAVLLSWWVATAAVLLTCKASRRC
jgi:NaMN:DMB phosphoribosyltransferase